MQMAQYGSGQISASCGPKSRIQGHRDVVGDGRERMSGFGMVFVGCGPRTSQ